jgi:hypothetical protein
MLASSRSDECRYPTDKVAAAALVVIKRGFAAVGHSVKRLGGRLKKRVPFRPIGFRLATFELVKLPTDKAFTIQNLKSKIQNGIRPKNPTALT